MTRLVMSLQVQEVLPRSLFVVFDPLSFVTKRGVNIG